ncbi:MAG TPA: hypothetical protein VKP08_16425 [Anaerolineales bacterium]|nr:hypothetical protein [Anaerolineales bacterium]
MTDTLQKTPREKSIKTGKRILVALVIYFILDAIFSLIFRLVSGQVMVGSAIRFVLTIVTSVYLFKGQNWARLLLSLGASLGLLLAVYVVYSQLRTPTTSLFNFIFLLILAILQGTAAYLLIFSTDIDEFLRSRKA